MSFQQGLSGLNSASQALDVLGNNIANANTVGYKTERTFFSVFNKAMSSGRNLPLTPAVNDGTVLAQQGLDFSQGALKPTGRNLDLAIDGNAFFMVKTPQGPQATRDGRFQVSPKGELQTQDGCTVLGKNGQALLVNPQGGEFTFTSDGTLQQGDTVVGRLDLKAYKTPAALPRMGMGRYNSAGMEEASAKATVNQGQLEQSGVDIASTMVQMIQLNRLFEMSLKVASTISNDLDARSINDIAAAR